MNKYLRGTFRRPSLLEDQCHKFALSATIELVARKNEHGRFIISAGEIGAYTVCPEAWRLRAVQKAKTLYTENISAGRKMHRDWVNKFEDSAYLRHRIRFVILLLSAAALCYILGLWW